MDRVSVIVRTCGRPDILKNCLKSIDRQSYSDIEVIVVEDGTNESEAVVRSYDQHMNIRYFATGERVGRAAAGNIAMKEASGKYLNFLDDDDELYPEHVSILAGAFSETECRAVYALAHEAQCRYSEKRKKYREFRKFVRFRQKFNRLYLLQTNYFPIQSVMFDRSLFTDLGGFREELECLEDWDLWVRYSTVTDFHMVDEITSFYRTPFLAVKRDINMRKARSEMRKYFSEYNMTVNLGTCHQEMYELVKEHYTSGFMNRIYGIGHKWINRK